MLIDRTRCIPFKRFVFFTLLSVFCFFSTIIKAQPSIPELWGQRVHDEAHALKPETADQLELSLKHYEDSTSNQIAILIIKTLDGASLEDYSIKVAEKWKLGQKGKDNGVLLFIAIDDHKMRIEVGKGLEGVLTDAQSNRIIRNEIAPNFRRGDYDAGVLAGIRGIIQSIGGEYKASVSDADDLSGSDLWAIGGFIFFILGLFTLIALIVPGGIAWGLYAFLLPFYAAFPGIVIGYNNWLTPLLIYAVGFPPLKLLIGKSSWGKKIGKGISYGSGGSGWSSSSSSGWSSGGSDSGFSGGGGSFGGGGSSGSW